MNYKKMVFAAGLFLAFNLSTIEAQSKAGSTIPTAPQKTTELPGLNELMLKEFSNQRLGDPELSFQYFIDSIQSIKNQTELEKLFEEAIDLAIQMDSAEKLSEVSNLWLKQAPSSLRPNLILLSLDLAEREDNTPRDYLINVINSAKENSDLELSYIFDKINQPSKIKLLQWLDYLIAQTKHQNNPYLYLCAAQLYVLQQDIKKSEQLNNLALKYKPDFEHALMLKAKLIRYKSNNDTSALNFLKTSLQTMPQLEELRIFYASALIDNQQYKKAKQELMLVKSKTLSADRDFLLSKLYTKNNQISDAKSLLVQLSQDKLLAPEAFSQLAELALAENKPLEAVKYLSSIESGEKHIEAYIKASQILVGQKKYSEALALIQDANPQNDYESKELILLQAEILVLNQESDRAFAWLNGLIKKIPDDTDLLYTRSIVAQDLKDFKSAENDLNTILKIEPETLNDPSIMYNLGWVNYQQGKFPESLSWFHKLFEATQDPVSFARYGELLWETGEEKKAQQIIQNGLTQYPNNKYILEVQDKIQKSRSL
ncbi:MAG: tetratricopeptide repeat protein [Gammaproteobacteria bacterium]